MSNERDEEVWQSLYDDYRERGIVLAFGAGISKDSQIPDWSELLRRLSAACHVPGGRQAVKSLHEQGYSLPAIASAIKAYAPSSEPFLEHVRHALYQNFAFNGQNIRAHNRQDFVDHIYATNTTLRTVAALCAVRDGPALYRRNPEVHAIVNFNLDTVFREYIQARYSSHSRSTLVRTIERSSKSALRDKISVYYMHGNLRFDTRAGDPGKESDTLILTDQEYFDFFNRPTGMFTHTFLTLLRDWTVLFIGLSMRDDNIRRLLHYSTWEREQAYLAEDKSDDPAATKSKRAQRQAIRHFAILSRHQDKKNLNETDERTLKALGTRVLWVDDYDELPHRLGSMYVAGGDPRKWHEVYGGEVPRGREQLPETTPRHRRALPSRRKPSSGT